MCDVGLKHLDASRSPKALMGVVPHGSTVEQESLKPFGFVVRSRLFLMVVY